MPARAPVRRAAIVELLRQHGRPMHVGELASRLGLEAHERADLREAIDELVFGGVLRQLAGQRYRLSPDAAEREARSVEGVIQLNPRGFGFVALGPADGDLFVPAEAVGGALHGDRVRARIVTRSRRGLEGVVDAVLERRIERVVGTLRVVGASRWLEPDDSRIRGPIVLAGRAPTEPSEPPPPRTPRSGARRNAADGRAAVVRITRYPELVGELAQGELIAELGLPGEPDVEVAKILLVHAVDEEHPPDAVAEAKALPTILAPALLAARVDRTDVPLVTIDPDDARDHDDAVWAERLDDGGYRVWVAIADVSHYVTPGSALDRSALARGCSVYLPDRAIPMLPAELSASLCSLLPGELRPCLCLTVDLAPTGAVDDAKLEEAVMRSRARLTYGGVARALRLTGELPSAPAAEERREGLELLWEIATLLRKRRLRRGALDFDLPDVRVALDDASGLPTGVSQRTGDPGVRKAYRLVEELMLLANECCAEMLVRAGRPTMFRVHAPPDVERLDRFASLLDELEIDIGADSLDEVAASPKRLGKLLERLRSHPSRSVLHSLLLRAMAQAAYDTVNIGHFGLASGAYLHFSSPIRRYPDLCVHRVLRSMLRGEPDTPIVRLPQAASPEPPRRTPQVKTRRSTGAREAGQTLRVAPERPTASPPAVEEDSPLRVAARLASDRERVAMEVERQVVDLYRALYMRGCLGAELEGRIASVTPSGVFVQIEEPFVDVLVTMDALGPDSYEMDEDGLRVVAVRSGERLTLGDAMKVRIEDVSLTRRSVYGRRVIEQRTARPRGARGRRRRDS